MVTAYSSNVICPNCNAQPGHPCTHPTSNGRRDVTWFHHARPIVEHDMQCETCHRTWSDALTPTPAGRCPFEDDHEDDEDSDTVLIYNVYVLCDGAVYEEEAFERIDDAVSNFGALVSRYERIKASADEFAETSVHIYDTALNSLIAEQIITKK